MAKDTDINEKVDRMNEITNRLKEDDLSRAEGENLWAEGHEQITALRDLLHGERDEILELED